MVENTVGFAVPCSADRISALLRGEICVFPRLRMERALK